MYMYIYFPKRRATGRSFLSYAFSFPKIVASNTVPPGKMWELLICEFNPRSVPTSICFGKDVGRSLQDQALPTFLLACTAQPRTRLGPPVAMGTAKRLGGGCRPPSLCGVEAQIWSYRTPSASGWETSAGLCSVTPAGPGRSMARVPVSSGEPN